MDAASDEPWTVGRLLDWTRQRFEAVGIDSPRVDAEHLLAFALECTRMNLYMDHQKVVNPPERARFRDLVKRRLSREPVAYIEGTRGFHALDLELSVDRRVLIPRPETELLVDWVLEDLPAHGAAPRDHGTSEPEPTDVDDELVVWNEDGTDKDASGGSMEEPVFVPDPGYGTQASLDGPEPSTPDATPEPATAPPADSPPGDAALPPDRRSVLDVGTGSGAIALALKRARPTVRVCACDISEEALAVAQSNAARLQLDVPMRRSDLLADVRHPPGGWTAITANLPYICTPVWRGLAPEVSRFEPRLALDGGDDGLDVIRRLVDTALAALASGAGLYLEIGYDQGDAVVDLMQRAGYLDVVLRRDHSGHPRIVRGRAP